MTVCGACGSDHPPGRRHCPSCGTGETQVEELSGWTTVAGTRSERSDQADAGRLVTDMDRARRIGDGTGQGEPGGEVGRRLLGTVLVVVGLALIAGGGYTAYQNRHNPPRGIPPGVRPTPSGRPTAPVSQPPASPTQSPSAPTSPVGTSGTPQIVAVAPALSGQPDVSDVTDTLTTYFTAINERDYEAYRSVLVGADNRVRNEDEFLRRFRSTSDSDVRLVGIRRDPDGEIFATVTFRSTQDPQDAPDGVSACVSWVLTYPMTRDGAGLKIDLVRPFAQTYRSC